MHGHNQPIGIAANIEHGHRLSATDMHSVRAAIAPAQLGHVSPCSRPHSRRPGSQIFRGLRILFRRVAEELFLNDPHAYNLCSPAEFVKHEKSAPAKTQISLSVVLR